MKLYRVTQTVSNVLEIWADSKEDAEEEAEMLEFANSSVGWVDYTAEDITEVTNENVQD